MSKPRYAAEDFKRFFGLFGSGAAAVAALVSTVVSDAFDRWALANHARVILVLRGHARTIPGLLWELVTVGFAAAAVWLWLRYVHERPPPKARPLDFATGASADRKNDDALEHQPPGSH